MSETLLRAGYRPLGLLEKLYTARHYLGLYHAISVLNTYRTRTAFDFTQTQNLFSAALATVIERHPILSYGIHGETTTYPSYVLVDKVDLVEKICYRELPSVDAILHQLQSELDVPWTSQESVPPWKLLIIQDSEGDPQIFHVAFIYHHALADGLSGVAFHASLAKALNELSTPSNLLSERLERISGNSSAKLKPCIENLVKFKISWSFLISEALQEYGPSLFQYFFAKKTTVFTGRDCEVSEMIPCRTNLRLLEINPDVVSRLLVNCQQKKVARTSLLSVIFVRALAIAVPSADAFIGSIPYSLRRFSGTGYDEMVNQVSALQTKYEIHLLQNLRLTSDVEEAIWLAAAESSLELQKHLRNCLQDNPVGLLSYVSDHRVFYQKKLGKKREQTFEVSNIGSVQSSASADDVWTVERVIFAQCAAPVGPALALNVAGVKGGPMTVTFSWQDKILDDEVVESAVREFKDMIDALAGQ